MLPITANLSAGSPDLPSSCSFQLVVDGRNWLPHSDFRVSADRILPGTTTGCRTYGEEIQPDRGVSANVFLIPVSARAEIQGVKAGVMPGRPDSETLDLLSSFGTKIYAALLEGVPG